MKTLFIRRQKCQRITACFQQRIFLSPKNGPFVWSARPSLYYLKKYDDHVSCFTEIQRLNKKVAQLELEKAQATTEVERNAARQHLFLIEQQLIAARQESAAVQEKENILLKQNVAHPLFSTNLEVIIIIIYYFSIFICRSDLLAGVGTQKTDR